MDASESANEAVVSDQTNAMDGRYIPTICPNVQKNSLVQKYKGLDHVETVQKMEYLHRQANGGLIKTGMVLGASAPAMKDGKEVGTRTWSMKRLEKSERSPNKDFTGTAESIVVPAE